MNFILLDLIIFNMKEKQVLIIDWQIILSMVFIITILISIIFSYDQRQRLLNKKTIFDKNIDKYLNLFNRIIVLIVILLLLYLNYLDYKINKDNINNPKPYYHQIIASVFSVISALIVLYVVIENWYDQPNITNIENPII